jgi:hypothetical protein
MKVATNLALSGALMFWMAAFAQEAVKPVSTPAPSRAAPQQECGKSMMEKMHASDQGGMKSGAMMKSGCMNQDRKPVEAASAKPDEHDHSSHAHK